LPARRAVHVRRVACQHNAAGAIGVNNVDVYCENVGGAVWDAVFPLLNPFARIPICGLVAQYNSTGPFEGPDRLPIIMRQVPTKSLSIRRLRAPRQGLDLPLIIA
jgi:NADPH-dependent curcumin reductase CurA